MFFQQIIFTLQNFWAAQGCAILQPIDIEVGAGTLHPATVLHALGSKPWKVAYVQPSRRPTDARYAQNPNRLSHYYQFQVLLKPAPKNIKDLYLQSLDLIGLNTKENDVRFVEDDWENPSVGASGLGWEVWFNGMEITQFTYMQQVGGIECDLIAGEITYGLERIAMHIQNVNSVFDIKWNEEFTYADIFKQAEIENSSFILEHSNLEILFRNFAESVAQSRLLSEKKLPIPAYEQALKASHFLNLLDARSAISVNERASYIAQIRTLVKAACELINNQS
ncbi:MAG: glycine--tRNA ligase subunit alpha [Alphaproteobacteria bacterium RIFCSPLOWO2_01_FULL_40_26]|nr:MAG: glycine--tRNA ligase subunit alpha [Alphaproteobacteria bacterium RIFCSPHIGHO2_02_FULL_40_34]OFW88459.1 MAG: glycine--tRNA ligase subunit alpha [Alphaproteobacteria bacterium RIFCSPHIGHO2_01_FULL_40_8]OFW94835.1 MAG: glycine--tRNA ligase subunit alpha [Alphaproteobacteria bacterium RIFCSPLOWO2_01_FULL_40_26]OFX10461.1 MAG: glycine--tRNA ligase subunit alpha [Alphaproteobacteria bacterium RIFCSPLOWO2_02_FULL_40_19]OFX11035.1 MAG: glycine--tRNA ligase subunit alpha [Alphaproteobacteria ba